MNSSLSHFKATLQRRKERKEKLKTKFNKKNLNYILDNINDDLEFPELSKMEMNKLKESIRKESRKHKQKEVLVLVVIMIIIFATFFIIFK